METVILAGGKGTRISEHTSGNSAIPKPLVKVNGRPLLWHVMNCYSRFGHEDFVVAAGYLQDEIKKYFLSLNLEDSNVTMNLKSGEHRIEDTSLPDWNVSIINTGEDTMTGGRLLQLRDHVSDTFFFTYGDGIADVNISELLAFHKQHGKHCTVTAVPHRSQFGILNFDSKGSVNNFVEKPVSDKDYISAGFFVCEKSVFEYIDDDMTVWEQDPMKRLLVDEQLMAFKHGGFWKSVDTLKDLNELSAKLKQGQLPWLEDSF